WKSSICGNDLPSRISSQRNRTDARGCNLAEETIGVGGKAGGHAVGIGEPGQAAGRFVGEGSLASHPVRNRGDAAGTVIAVGNSFARLISDRRGASGWRVCNSQ